MNKTTFNNFLNIFALVLILACKVETKLPECYNVYKKTPNSRHLNTLFKPYFLAIADKRLNGNNFIKDQSKARFTDATNYDLTYIEAEKDNAGAFLRSCLGFHIQSSFLPGVRANSRFVTDVWANSQVVLLYPTKFSEDNVEKMAALAERINEASMILSKTFRDSHSETSPIKPKNLATEFKDPCVADVNGEKRVFVQTPSCSSSAADVLEFKVGTPTEPNRSEDIYELFYGILDIIDVMNEKKIYLKDAGLDLNSFLMCDRALQISDLSQLYDGSKDQGLEAEFNHVQMYIRSLNWLKEISSDPKTREVFNDVSNDRLSDSINTSMYSAKETLHGLEKRAAQVADPTLMLEKFDSLSAEEKQKELWILTQTKYLARLHDVIVLENQYNEKYSQESASEQLLI